MRLLLDQNVSHRLVKALASEFPESAQVSFLQLDKASDVQIWEYAREHDFAIVTLDADFHEYSMLNGGPPLIVWLKCGNQPRNVILDKLLSNSKAIQKAQQDADTWCIEVY